MAKNKRERLLLGATALVVAAFAADRMVITPLTELWSERSERIEELTARLEKGELLAGREEAIDEQWEAMHDGALPEDAAAAEREVLTAIGEWASRSRINVTALKPRWVEDEELGRLLEIRLSAGGSLEALSRFLYELEREELALRLEDVDLSARDTRGAELSLDARFTGILLAEESS